jgi:hypothetical protein
MPENVRKARLMREALGESSAPMPSAGITPAIAYVAVALLCVAAITGGLRLDEGVPSGYAIVSAANAPTATSPPSISPDARDGNVQDLTY